MNEQRKQAFLNESTIRGPKVIAPTARQFQQIAELEDRLGKDACDFTSAEILGYYKSLCTTSINYLVVINSQLKLYAAWCQQNNMLIDYQNHYAELDVDVLRGCLNVGLQQEIIITREELLHIIEALENPSDKFLCLAVFEGILGPTKEELRHIRIEDFENGEVTLYGRDGKSTRRLTVSDELIGLAKESASTYEYVQFTEGKRVYYYHAQDPNVLKRFANSSGPCISSHSLQDKMVRIKKELDSPAFVYGYLFESGRLQRINELIKSGRCESAYDALSNPAITYRYGAVHSKSGYVELYKDYIYTEES